MDAFAAQVPGTRVRRMPVAGAPISPDPFDPLNNFVLRNKKVTEYIVNGKRAYQEQRHRA